MERVERHESFGGSQEVWKHASSVLGVDMKVGVFIPPQAKKGRCPVVYWLSGLTCTEQNFLTKGGFQQFAAKHGIIVVAPDTSPRGDGVPDDESYDLGQGAGFYVNATREPWAKHFKMYDYVVKELLPLIDRHFPTSERRGISGHSMGGHGALMIALKNPGLFKSVSAFSPIVAPSQVPWGEKAFGAYLGDTRETWLNWDTCALIEGAEERLHLLVDQGAADDFLPQLQPHLLQEACETYNHPITLRMQPGYDHSYYFVSTFMGDHFAHHADALLT